VAFITVTEDDDPINKQVDVVRTPNDVDTVAETSGMKRVLSVSWVFYGPTSYDTAFHIKRKLFQSSYNSFLAPYKIYLVPSIKAPVRIPEIYAGQYWERTDLKVQFNSLSTFDELIAYIKSAEFKIVNNRGEEKDVFINTENNS
jgi:hypothetical protein